MESDLYQAEILDRYHHPRHAGEPEKYSRKLEGANRSCGDEICFFLTESNGIVNELQFTSRACAICTASADLLADRLIGQPIQSIGQISTDDVKKMIGLTLSPIRLKCALLPLETLKAALEAE